MITDEECFGNNNGSVQIVKNGNTFWQINLYNAQNTLIKSIHSNSFTAVIDSLPSGNYHAELLSKGIVENINFYIQPGTLVIANYSFLNDTIYLSEGANMQLSNSSVNALNYQWNFGDGVTSTITNPSHSYNAVGNYVVSLKAFNGGCSAEIKDSITVELNRSIITSIKNIDNIKMELINSGNKTFEIKSHSNTEKKLFVTDLNGKCLLQNSFRDNNFRFDLGLLQSGIYVINVVSEKENLAEKIFIF